MAKLELTRLEAPSMASFTERASIALSQGILPEEPVAPLPWSYSNRTSGAIYSRLMVGPQGQSPLGILQGGSICCVICAAQL